MTAAHRVDKIAVSTIMGRSFKEIFHYKLGYRFSDLSPAFWLESFQKIMNNGEKEPIVSFNYELPSEFLMDSAWSKSNELTELSSKLQHDLIDNSKLSLFDLNADGMPDIEFGKDYKRYISTENGFRLVKTNHASPASEFCLEPAQRSRNRRNFARILGPGHGLHIYHFSKRNKVLYICGHDAQLIFTYDFNGDWKSAIDLLRIIDINKDFKPDIVYMQKSGFEVIYNTSEGEKISFSDIPMKTPLESLRKENGYWFLDINGDGQLDLINQGSNSFEVFYGSVGSRYKHNYLDFPIYYAKGKRIPVFSKKRIQFVDLNKDSLPDLLVLDSNSMEAYINTGDSFQFIEIPGLANSISRSYGLMAGELDGSGYLKLFASVSNNNEVHSFPLDKKGLGLIKKIDDGKGSTVEYFYDQSSPKSGVTSRKTVVSKVVSRSNGDGEKVTDIDYKKAYPHSKTTSLLGFENIAVTSNDRKKSLTEYVFTENDLSKVAKVTSFDTKRDWIKKSTENAYETSYFNGLPVVLKKKTVSSIKDEKTESISSSAKKYSYDENLCPEKEIFLRLVASLLQQKAL